MDIWTYGVDIISNCGNLLKVQYGAYKPTAEDAWTIAKALSDMGVSWSCGPLGLAMCLCDEQLLGVFGYLLRAKYDGRPLLRLLNIAPFEPQIRVLNYPKAEPYDQKRLEERIRLIEAWARPTIARSVRRQKPTQAELDIMLPNRNVLLELPIIDVRSSDALEMAWRGWTDSDNQRLGIIPNRIAEWIDALNRSDKKRPLASVVSQESVD